MTCRPYTHRVTVNVSQPTLTGIRIEPDPLLLLGVGAETEIGITEFYSSGVAQPSQSAALSVADADVLRIDGRTVIALRPGRTTLVAAVGEVREEVDVDVVAVVGAGRGVVTARGGGVLSDSQSFGQGAVSGKLILRPESVARDGEFQFELLDPKVLPDIGGGEVAIAAFDVGPRVRFARKAIARIENSFSLSDGTLISLSRVDDIGGAYERVGFVPDSNIHLEAKISHSGTYVLHVTQSTLAALRQKYVRISGSEKISSLQSTGECNILHKDPRPVPLLRPVVPSIYWEHESDLSHCDRKIDGGNVNKLLIQYRPILKVRGVNRGEKLYAHKGEFPIRVSDMLRQGRLYDNKDENQIDYKNDRNMIGENDARNELFANDNSNLELQIQNDDLVSNWRDFLGIPVVYGRVAVDGYGETTFTALQYWMYYAGSTTPQGDILSRKVGDFWLGHEGDVEFVQVLLDENNDAIGMSVGQHYYGESRHWNEVEKSKFGNPILYVAFGTHATHFSNIDAKSMEGNLGFLAREGNSKKIDKGKQATDQLKYSIVEIAPAIIEIPIKIEKPLELIKEISTIGKTELVKGISTPENVFFTWKGRFGQKGSKIEGVWSSGVPAPLYRGPGSPFYELSMFINPASFHFTYLMPGSDFGGMMEALSRARLGKVEQRGIDREPTREEYRNAIQDVLRTLTEIDFPLNGLHSPSQSEGQTR